MRHLTLDVERFWFPCVIAGEPDAAALRVAGSKAHWYVPEAMSAEEVFADYRSAVARTDTVLATAMPEQRPTAWPVDIRPTWRLPDVRHVLLHVLTEVAFHCGHLDAACELIDGHLARRRPLRRPGLNLHRRLRPPVMWVRVPRPAPRTRSRSPPVLLIAGQAGRAILGRMQPHQPPVPSAPTAPVHPGKRTRTVVLPLIAGLVLGASGASAAWALTADSTSADATPAADARAACQALAGFDPDKYTEKGSAGEIALNRYVAAGASSASAAAGDAQYKPLADAIRRSQDRYARVFEFDATVKKDLDHARSLCNDL